MRTRTLPSLPARQAPDGPDAWPRGQALRRHGALFVPSGEGFTESLEQTVTFTQQARAPGTPLAGGRYRR